MILKGSEFAMQADEKLDLCGIIAPYSFLLCKSTLASMRPGTILEVHLSDPDTLEDLLIILNRSGEKIITRVQHGDRTCFWVQKGVPGRSPWPEEPEGVNNG
jgi:TusA-related sulfurtransferase